MYRGEHAKEVAVICRSSGREFVAGPVFFVTVKYGKIPDEERQELLPKVDFTLPADHLDTGLGLSSGLSPDMAASLEVRAGGTMWTIRPWRGSVYPQKAPQRTWPTHYGKAFGTIELNATHYRIHPPERMAEWAAAMPADFRFCAKFPAIITHYRRFNDSQVRPMTSSQDWTPLALKEGRLSFSFPPIFLPSTLTDCWLTSRNGPGHLRRLSSSATRAGLSPSLNLPKRWRRCGRRCWNGALERSSATLH